MGAAALRPSVRVGSLLRNQRKELRLTLHDVSRKIQEKGEPLPISTLVRIEQGKLDPGVRRLHLLLRLYETPAHLVSDLIELEQMAVEEPKEKSLQALLKDGMAFWKEGDLGKGLSHLMAIRVYEPKDSESRLLKNKACIAFAGLAREMGKLKLAKMLLEDLLLEPIDRSLAADALIQLSVVWNSLGAPILGLATIRQAAEYTDGDDHEKHAQICHQEAKLHLKQKQSAAALKSVDCAINRYRKAKNTTGEAKALIVKIDIQESLGDLEAANRTARSTIRYAETNDLRLVAASARYHLGRLLVIRGLTQEGVEELRAAQAEAMMLEAKIIQFHTHFYLWKVYVQEEDNERSRFELHSAKHLLEFIDSSTEATRELRKYLAEHTEPRRRRKRKI